MTNPNGVEVLLVEDNPQHVELLLRALRKHNLANHVFVAKDGAQALAFLFDTDAISPRKAEPHPKVIILDLKLPKIDGLEVLCRIKSDERTQLIPVVVLTTSQQEQDIIRSYRLGVNSYIVKPVRFDGFVQTVSEVAKYWMVRNTPPLDAGC